MIRVFFFFILLLQCIDGICQVRPNYVPFYFNGKAGFMDTTGNILKDPGLYAGNFLVVGDFKKYIGTEENSSTDFLIDAVSGHSIYIGTLDKDCGALKIDSITWYHFNVEGISQMLGVDRDTAGSVFLQKNYDKIESDANAWSNGYLSRPRLIWALKEDGTYDILNYDKGFEIVEDIAPFESYDLVFQVNKNGPPTVIGFVTGSKTAISREFGQLYDIPPSEEKVAVYNSAFQLLGSTSYRSDSIGSLFKKKVQLRGGMIAPPEMANQPIYANGSKPIVLNNEFSLVPNKDNKQLILVNTKKQNRPVLGNGSFDYRYISSSKNLEALLQVRHRVSGAIFYFDFDGTFFPKGVPLIQASLRTWEEK
ncbi:MAG: hypothetical protein QM727_07005 [Niabella sp.]